VANLPLILGLSNGHPTETTCCEQSPWVEQTPPAFIISIRYWRTLSQCLARPDIQSRLEMVVYGEDGGEPESDNKEIGAPGSDEPKSAYFSGLVETGES